MPEAKAPDSAAEEKLSANVDRLVAYANKMHNINWWQSYLLGVLALLSSSAVVVAGMYDKGRWSALLGLFTSFLLAYERFDPSEAKSQFYREIRTQAQRLQRDLLFHRRRLEEIHAEYEVLELNLAKQIPRQGLGDAIKELNERLAHLPR